MLAAGKPVTAEAVKLLASASTVIEVPNLAGETVDLAIHDNLLGEVGS